MRLRYMLLLYYSCVGLRLYLRSWKIWRNSSTSSKSQSRTRYLLTREKLRLNTWHNLWWQHHWHLHIDIGERGCFNQLFSVKNLLNQTFEIWVLWLIIWRSLGLMRIVTCSYSSKLLSSSFNLAFIGKILRIKCNAWRKVKYLEQVLHELLIIHLSLGKHVKILEVLSNYLSTNCDFQSLFYICMIFDKQCHLWLDVATNLLLFMMLVMFLVLRLLRRWRFNLWVLLRWSSYLLFNNFSFRIQICRILLIWW